MEYSTENSDRLHIAAIRRGGVRIIISYEKCVKREENNWEWYLRNSSENLLISQNFGLWQHF